MSEAADNIMPSHGQPAGVPEQCELISDAKFRLTISNRANLHAIASVLGISNASDAFRMLG